MPAVGCGQSGADRLGPQSGGQWKRSPLSVNWADAGKYYDSTWETATATLDTRMFLKSSGRQRCSGKIGPVRPATHLRDGRSRPVDMYASR